MEPATPTDVTIPDFSNTYASVPIPDAPNTGVSEVGPDVLNAHTVVSGTYHVHMGNQGNANDKSRAVGITPTRLSMNSH